MMKVSAGFLASCALLLATSAYAADAIIYEPVSPPAPERFEAYDWSGFYVGAHAGYGTGKARTTMNTLNAAGDMLTPTANVSFDADGFLGGAQVGYNFQADQFVFGVEGEYSFANIKGSFHFDPTRPEAMAGGKLSSIAAIKARAGVAFDRTLLFATAGYAMGKIESHINNYWALAPAVDVATGKDTLHGFVAGAGVEHALTDNISLKGEYNFYGFGRGDFNMLSSALPPGAVLKTEPKINLHTFKVGVNFHF